MFPYLSILLYVDAGAAIDVLSIAMDSPDAVFRETGDVAVPPPISPASAVPTSFRQSAKVPRGRGRGRESGDDTVEGRGGVWGKRIGKGRARAIGWAGASATAGLGAGAEGRGVGAEGWTEGGGGGSSAEVADNVCPSRRTIVEVKRSGRQRETPSSSVSLVCVSVMCASCGWLHAWVGGACVFACVLVRACGGCVFACVALCRESAERIPFLV